MKLADLLRFLATFLLALLTVKQLKLLLLDWFNCNWEIMSADVQGLSAGLLLFFLLCLHSLVFTLVHLAQQSCTSDSMLSL